MAASVQIAPDAKGDRLVICRTAQGITTPLKFVIGTLPEVVEVEKEGVAKVTDGKGGTNIAHFPLPIPRNEGKP